MATNLSNVTFSNVYKDDFTDSDNYHRILFNSGKALQARELTQSQTIIQKEIERFGANIFKQGGAVNGGNLTIDNKVEYINLANGELPSSPATLIGKYYKDSIYSAGGFLERFWMVFLALGWNFMSFMFL